MDKFVLIDGNSLINRAFYATPVMTNGEGVPTNAVYAFMNMLVKIIADVKPRYMLVAFDRKEPTFRHKIFSEYKGTRKPMPDDLVPQIPLLKTVLDELGICRYELAGIEADDIIGTLAKKYDFDTIIYTGDKDSFQLVDETTSVYFTKRGITDIEEYTAYNFVEKIGFSPLQIIDFKALKGDVSDNIPGVAGVGDKTAVQLIKDYGSIENLYSDIQSVKGKLAEKLIEDKDNCFLSKTLATININVDIPLSVSDLEYTYPFPSKAKELFTKLEFRNLLKRTDLFDSTTSATVRVASVSSRELTSAEEITSVIKSDKIAVIIEDNICFYQYDGIEYALKIKSNFFDDGFEYFDAIAALKPIFEDETKSLVVYGKKNLMHLLDGCSITLKAKADDLLLIKYLTDYSGKEETFSEIMSFYGYDKAYPAYALSDLFDNLYKKADDAERSLYNDVELPLCTALYDTEREGFKVDKDNLIEMSAFYKNKCADLLKQICTIAGEEINPNSSKQLSVVLFEKLGLKHGKKIKTGGYSTDSDVLEKLIDEHPIISLILEYRKYNKLLTTYIDGFKPLIDKNGLIHTTYYQAQTSTGRLSSRKPNLQNIPVRNDEGREVRKLFSAKSQDRVLIDADYSQIELRLMAAFSGCQALIDAFNKNVDVHARTAANVFNVPIENVTPQMRRDAKAVNFGIIYGISDYGLADNLGIGAKAAGEYIKKYFETYPEVKEYMDKNVEFAKKNGYAVTMLGRKRYIREINAQNYNLRTFGERVAMNMPLQGSAADIIKIAMINVYKTLKDRGLKSKLILQVHDELVIDAFVDEKDEVRKILVDCMENAVKLSVPLTVEVNESYNWYDCK